ncbi:MAG TPA: hypothetical protein VGE44_01580 [Daejeonella sp.]|uniref:FEKKY domain-containing protein n=1 Tax=Daejeonella sp. TaxID=2805397 RepID=UPI002ED8FF76
MKYLITIFLISICVTSFGQGKRLTDKQINESGAQKLLFLDDINKVKGLATKDIQDNIALLLLQSGDAPIVYLNDRSFEEKYNITYFESGCIGPTAKFAVEYNKYIFEYLDSKFGKGWRREIRKDVIGLKEFRQSQ